jgi:hypothetical protein
MCELPCALMECANVCAEYVKGLVAAVPELEVIK